MSTGLHKDLDITEIHRSHSLVFADATTRGAFVATSSDVGRIAHQTDNNSFWILVDDSPLTWNQIDSDSNAIHTNVAGEIAGLTLKAVPLRTDPVVIEDSALGNVKRKATIQSLPVGNVYPVDKFGTLTTIYVRSTGSDTTGDGKTIGTAYRTIYRALQDLPLVIYNDQYLIECSGLGQELITSPILFPPVISQGMRTFTSVRQPGFTVTDAVTIEAAPTIIDTITSGELSGQTQETTTSLRTLQTTKNYTLNQHRGRFIRDSTNKLAVIASNTAGPNSSIEVTTTSALTASIQIWEPSCEIRNTDVAGGNAVEMHNLTCGIWFNGIKLTVANPSAFRYGLYLDAHKASFGTTGCIIDGIFVYIGTYQPSFSSTYFTKRLSATGIAVNLFSCFIYGSTVAFRNGGNATDICFWFQNIFDTCESLGGGTGIEDTNSMSLSLDQTIIRNGTGNAVYCPPGGLMRLRRSRATNNTGNGVTVDGGRVILEDYQGSGNTGIGVLLQNGSQVERRAPASTVTGTDGDRKVGGNAVATWASFGGNDTDLAAANPQLCRMYT